MNTLRTALTLLAAAWLASAAEPAQAQEPANVTQLIRDSQSAQAAGDTPAAESLARAATDLDPAHPPAWRQYGQVLLRATKPAEAAVAFQRAADLDANDAPAWRGLAQARWQAAQHQEAVRALSAFLRLKPEDAPAWRDLAAWLTRLEQGEQAVAALERAVGLNPDDASAWRELGAWHLRLQNPERAATALERAVALSPDAASAWRDLAAARTALSRHAQAAEALATLTRLNPDDASAWREYATALTRLNQPDAAVAALERAVALSPDAASAWRALARLHQAAGRGDAALNAFERALAAHPADPATRRDLGWFLWTRGQRDQALERLTEAIETGVEARDRVIFQVAARLCEEGAYDRARAFLKRVAPQDPPSALGLTLARAGRLRAAAPLLAAAWQEGERTPEVGLYLAYARAVNSEFTGLSDNLAPLLATPAALTAEHLDLALETLRLGSARPETPALAERLEALLASHPEGRARVTDILERAADASRARGETAQALRLYRRVLDRDPDRACWFWALLLAERAEGKTPFEWLDAYALRAHSHPARTAGVAGVRAERQGRPAEALPELRRSLTLDPQQADLRQLLFGCLLSLGRLAEARAETEWFERQVEAGEGSLRPYLAEQLNRLGEPRAALSHWELLYQANPDSLYYGIESAQALFRLGQPDDARARLEALTANNPDPRPFEGLAEIAAARALPRETLAVAERGLAEAPSPALLRYRAEALEALGTLAPKALADAQAFLSHDPGNVPMSLLAARLLEATGQTNTARAFHQGLLSRNPAFVPSLIALRDDGLREARLAEAARHEQTRAALLPHDADAARGYASLLAQHSRFQQALPLLRPLADPAPADAVPVLVYATPTHHPYDGRNRTDRLARHIARLASEGFAFINTFGQLAENPGKRRVLLLLLDPDTDTIAALDPVLQRHGACVAYAGNAAFPALTLSGRALTDRAAPALASGRWRLASGGPADFRRGPADAAGVLGNPLTHPLVSGGSRESAEAFAARLDQTLGLAARSLKDQPERLLVYPAGDFGQRSLDTAPEQLDTLRQAVSRHFTHAVYFDPSGFFDPSRHADPLRIPARLVPPDWDEDALARHVTAGNPVTRARLDLARALYWHGQHEAAHAAFARALEAGADPQATLADRGFNAERQGDLHTARAHLRAALESDPDATRVRDALDRLEARRRPQATLFLSGWMDNEDRDHYRYGGTADAFVSERLRLGVLADRDRWSTDGVGSAHGTRLGLRGLAFLAPQVWLSGSLWRLDMDTLEDHWGGDLALRLPNPWLSGSLTLTASREEIETVEALRKGIDANTYALRTYTRLRDVWDLFADLSHTQRTDGNDTTSLDGRLLYRLQEWPYVAAGWRFRFADSDRDPPEYWAPEGLQQHQAHITVRGARGRLSYAASAEAGFAKERDTDWRFVWGARGLVEYAFHRRFSASAELGYFESPDYERWHGRVALTGRF